MPLLRDEDYEWLRANNISIVEVEASRFIIFMGVVLPEVLYTDDRCNVLVVIPANYNQDGNDMLWTDPRLKRKDGLPIPATTEKGGGDSRCHAGVEYCRWSRHWHQPPSVVWRQGMDDIRTIYRRIVTALEKPGG